KAESEGIDRRLDEAREGAQEGRVPKPSLQKFEKLAERNKGALDRLPPDPAGRIRELQEYDFIDPDAKKQFEDLLASLREQAMKPFMQGMQQAMGNMSPEDLKRMREVINDLNRMLREKAEGGE